MLNLVKKFIIFTLLIIPEILFASTAVTINVSTGLSYSNSYFYIYDASDNLVNSPGDIVNIVNGKYIYNLGSSAVSYKFGLKLPGLSTIYANNQATLSSADYLSLPANSHTDIYFDVSQAGSTHAISGTVRNRSGSTVLSGIKVQLFDSNNNWVSYNITNGSGNYSFGDLYGAYYLKAEDDANNYFSQWYNDAYGYSDRQAITVSGSDVTGRNFYLYNSATINGQVTNNATGSNLSGVLVAAFIKGSAFRWVSEATTAADGTYKLYVPAGVDLMVRANLVNFQETFYKQEFYNWRNSTTQNLSANENRLNINFSLPPAYALSGTITNYNGGAALSGVTVNIFDTAGNWLKETTTNASGYYALNLINGSYYVQAQKSNFFTQYYNNAWGNGDRSSTTISSAALPNINFSLHQNATIQGTIYNGDSGGTLNNAGIYAFIRNGSFIYVNQVTGNGTYSLTVPSGVNLMLRSRVSGFDDVFYNQSANWNNSTTINLSPGATTTNINFTHYGVFYISGTVQDRGTTDLSNIRIDVFNSSGVWVKNVTANSGTYSVSVNNGAYYLKASDPASQYFMQFYNDAFGDTDRDPITVSGTNVTNRNFSLYRAATVSGTLTDGTLPLNNVNVAAFIRNGSFSYVNHVTSNAAYTLTVPAGLSLMIRATKAGYMETYYDQAYTWNSSATVNVSAGGVSSNIDFALYKTGTVNGTVTYDSGGNVSGAAVVIYNASSYALLASGYTNASGVYAIGNVMPGNIKILVTANSCRSEFYNNIPQDVANSWSLATTLSLTSGGALNNINFGLERRWRVGGTVTLSDGSSPLGAEAIYQFGGTSTVSVSVAANGYYEYWGTSNVTNPLLITVSKNNYTTVTRSITVTLGSTDITTLNVTLVIIETPLPPWFDNIEDSIKSGPNPANPEEEPVHIGFAVEDTATARILIYTLGGELVFSDSRKVSRGYHEFVWEGDDRYRQTVPNGVYLGYMEIKTSGKTYKKVLKIAILK